MKKYIDMSDERALTASFEFTDVDGNTVIGKYSNNDVFSLIEMLSCIMVDDIEYETKNPIENYCNGIIDTRKPINIKIARTVL